MAENISAERLRELLHYEPETGVFTRRTSTGGRNAGEVAGTNKDGYVQIAVGGRVYRAHRLAWLYVHGEWPPGPIDHRNRERSDNRIANLRILTNAENMQNRVRPRSDSGSGLMGAFYNRKTGKWVSKIKRDGHLQLLGYFPTPEAAHAAYMAAKAQVHPCFEK